MLIVIKKLEYYKNFMDSYMRLNNIIKAAKTEEDFAIIISAMSNNVNIQQILDTIISARGNETTVLFDDNK